jgi:hypothetical protein
MDSDFRRQERLDVYTKNAKAESRDGVPRLKCTVLAATDRNNRIVLSLGTRFEGRLDDLKELFLLRLPINLLLFQSALTAIANTTLVESYSWTRDWVCTVLAKRHFWKAIGLRVPFPLRHPLQTRHYIPPIR